MLLSMYALVGSLFQVLVHDCRNNWTGTQIINQVAARARNGEIVQRGFKRSTKQGNPRGFIPLCKYYVIVSSSSQTSSSQTSRNDNHTATWNCGQCNKNVQVRCDKKSQENKFKHFRKKYEMIMESIFSKVRDLPSSTDIVSLWLFACGSSQLEYATKHRIWTPPLYICTPPHFSAYTANRYKNI